MEQTFITIAIFQYSQEAHVFRSKLEAHNIKVHLDDEFTVDVDPFVSNAIGGVKLRVLMEDQEAAESLLRETHPEVLLFRRECPDCSGKTHRLAITLGNFLKQLFPVSDNMKYVCQDCKTKFYSK